MKQAQINVAGISVTRNVPQTPVEYDTAVNAAANPNASALALAVKATLNQKDIPAILRLAVVGRAASNGTPELVGLEKLTGQPRKTTQKTIKGPKGNGSRTITVNDEDDAEYIARVFPLATRTPEQVQQLTSVLNAASAALPFGSNLPERATVAKPLKGKWLKEATRFIGDAGALSKVQAAFKTVLNRQYAPVVATPVDDPKNLDALGRLLHDFSTANTKVLQGAFKK